MITSDEIEKMIAPMACVTELAISSPGAQSGSFSVEGKDTPF
jgi:hypothetical protein